MHILVNGNDQELQENCTLTECIEKLKLPSSGVAIAVNNEVVPKNNWDSFSLSENDKLLVIRATSGG